MSTLSAADIAAARARMKSKADAAGVKSGGKGAVRRPKKVATAKGGADDKKLAATLKKLEVKPINGIEEVILHKQDGSTVVFKDPKLQANLEANTFVIIGDAETRGGVAPAGGAAAEDEDEMPSLENTNFEKEAAK